jgi:hypothetical protein
MEDINLEKYKSAWKEGQGFPEEKLSRDQIAKFMQLTSKNISGLFKKSLLTDIVIKLLLSLLFALLLVLLSNQNRIQIVNAALILLTLFSIVIQLNVYRQIPDVTDISRDVKSLLISYINFYSQKFILSLIINSLSAVLFIICGAFYYFYYKYETIRILQFGDYLVFGTIIVAGFLLSLFVQVKNFNFHIQQLERSLADIEQEVLSESKLRRYKNINKRNIIIYSVILIAGLVLLIMFLFNANSG